MNTLLSWVDESPEKMEAVRQYIRSMEPEGAVDLLGFSRIRDRYSFIFFPMVITNMTRARYYIFIPSICIEIERQRLSGNDATSYLRLCENKIRELIYDTNHGETGIIGRIKGDKINMFPSDLYWWSMSALGILRKQSMQKNDYFKSLDNYYNYMSGKTSERNNEEDHEYFEPNWDPNFNIHLNFEKLSSLDFKLRSEEAHYLREKYLDYAEEHGQTMMAFIMSEYKSLKWDNLDWAQLAHSVDKHKTVSDSFKHDVKCAFRFRLYANLLSQLYLVYLCRLKYSENSLQYNNAVDYLNEIVKDTTLQSSIKLFERWIYDTVGVDIDFFVNTWTVIKETGLDADSLVSSEKMEHLVKERELRKKGHKARLTHTESRNNWGTNDPYSGFLDYRLGTARVIARDIIRGLNA